MPDLVTVSGLRELRKALFQTIPEHYHGKVLQKALAAGARPIVAEARNLAPVQSGVLRKSIYSGRDRKNSTATLEQRLIAVRSGKRFQKAGKDAFYWRWVEFGRGEITAGKSRILFNKRTNEAFGKTVRAVPAKPFLRPAFQTRRNEAVGKIRDTLAKEITVVARKARWTQSRR